MLGRLLRGVRAGDANLFSNLPGFQNLSPLRLESAWFAESGTMPLKSAGVGVGDNISPPLSWSGVPPETQAFLIVIQDPDAPLPRPFVHLVAFNIPGESTSFAKGALNKPTREIRFGRNTFGGTGYRGPRALRGHGPHRYVFQLVALTRPLTASEGLSLRAVADAAAPVALALGTLTGIFERP